MKKRNWLIVGILIAAAAAFGYGYFYRGEKGTPKYRTARVELGRLSSFVTVNGTVNPVITVLVGSQVSGTIQKLYADFNSRVARGQLIAQIDPATFQAQLSQASAKVQNAKASVLNAEADIASARANTEAAKANFLKAKVAVEDTRRSLDRALELFRRNLISASERDAAQTAHDSALAQLEAAQAQQRASEAQQESARARRASAQAGVKQAEAELELAQVNLNHTKITAPVNGIVISRNVDVGQTVAASLQAPTLFSIAQDLTEMQVEANVSEADIGRVAQGQETTFTVDAYPQNLFRGRVTQIRNAPITVQNVVTYTVVIRVRNPDLKLKPGMTANASILVAHREGILKIPNAALRFRPDFARREAAAPAKAGTGKEPEASPAPPLPNLERLTGELHLSAEQQAAVGRILKEARPGPETDLRKGPAAGQGQFQENRRAARAKIRALLTDEQKKKYDTMISRAQEGRTAVPVYRLWVPVAGGNPRPVDVTTGISDGTFTEIVSGDLAEGQDVILEALGPNTKGTASGSAAPSFRVR